VYNLEYNLFPQSSRTTNENSLNVPKTHYTTHYTSHYTSHYGVALASRIDKIISLFCKRDL